MRNGQVAKYVLLGFESIIFFPSDTAAAAEPVC